MNRTVGSLLVMGLATFAACARGDGRDVSTLRLVDAFADAAVEGAIAARPASDPIGWRFDDRTDEWGAHDVADLGVREGRLRGRTLSETSIVHAERTGEMDGNDLLHAVEISIRVSHGSELALRFDSGDEPDVQRALGDTFPWALTTPLVPGDALQRYTLKPSRPVGLTDVRHVLLRPSDEAGSEFEIESIRIVSRREHLASVESGVGWHGMGDVYRETIVTHAAETVTFELNLPERPWLDVALATVEDGAATFRIEIHPAGGKPLVFERTVSRPHVWNDAQLVLEGLDRQPVRLTLSLEADREAFLGFWGTTAIRSGLAARSPATDRPQAVIVLLADTLRSDHVNAWGYTRDTAPFLGSLATEGARAADCVSQATWTKVSVPSIFTSLYPTTHTVAEFTDRLPVSADTMAEVFRAAGYATLALTSIPFAGQFTNLHQGYEELHERSSLVDSSDAKTAREYMDRLLPWVEKHRDVPFFVFLHVADPHSPYRAYSPFDSKWGKLEEADRLAEQIEQVRPHIENPLMQRFGMPSRDELVTAGLDPDRFVGYELDAYDGSILAMDVEVRRLFERLRELGLAERTLFAFVSDHGTEFLDHGRHFHGQSVYGELNRVPLFFWGPGLVPGGVVLQPTVQTIDLMPTLLELAGIAAPDRVQGRSLVTLIEQTARGEEHDWRRPAITEKAAIETVRGPMRNYESIALISDGWKLIRNESAELDEYELYDHLNDPLNLKDLSGEQQERVIELAALLREWREAALAARLDDAALAEDLDAQELERLRSLGYLQ